MDTETTTTLATLTAFERSCPCDDFDTESGGGMPDDVEPSQVDRVTITADDLADGGRYEWCTLEAAVMAALLDLGCSEWDGGSTAYDPDGSSMAFDAAGTITERYVLVEIPEPAADDLADGFTYRVVRMYFSDDYSTETIARGLSLDAAQAHCKDPETSSRTATGADAVARTARCGPWFDGYEIER